MTLKYPVWIMLQHRKLEVTALNEKSEYTVSLLCLGFGEVHTGVHVYVHAGSPETPTVGCFLSALLSYLCCKQQAQFSLFNFNRTLFPIAMVVSQ